MKVITPSGRLGLFDSDTNESINSSLTIDISEFCPNSNECWIKYGYAKRGLIAQICDHYEKGTDMGTTVHYFIQEHNERSLSVDSVFQSRANILGISASLLAEIIYDNAPVNHIRTNITDQQFMLLRDSGNIVALPHGKKFYFIPFWFEAIDEETNYFAMHSLGRLPTDLKDAIHNVRGTEERDRDKELDSILDKLELGTISASEAKPKIKSLFV